MFDKILKQHPTFHFTQDISDICLPLQLLNIHYFSHVNINAKKQFSAISSNPEFSGHYLNNHYYNADIHMADNNTFGNYVVWDSIEKYGESARMEQEAMQFGIKHTFTIIQKNSEQGTDFYHFATNNNSCSINQTYLINLDLLKIFIVHFREKVLHSKKLSSAYSLKFGCDKNAAGYTTNFSNIPSQDRSDFINQISWHKTQSTHPFLFEMQFFQNLSPREKECLYFYVHGKTAKEIGEILFLSRRTIEQFLMTIKIKLNVPNKAALIEKVLDHFYVLK